VRNLAGKKESTAFLRTSGLFEAVGHVERRSVTVISNCGLAPIEREDTRVEGNTVNSKPSLKKGHPWPLAPEPPVRPWTRPMLRSLFSAVPGRIGFPTDMGYIGRADSSAATFL
jgi:hypothetical protein